MREGVPDPPKFYRGGIRLYPENELYREMSFISYYFHWGEETVLNLSHGERRKWCREISDINKSLNPSKDKKEKSILEMRPTREATI